MLLVCFMSSLNIFLVFLHNNEVYIGGIQEEMLKIRLDGTLGNLV